MSEPRNPYTEQFTERLLDSRTVDEIKSEIKSKTGKPGKRRAIMQVFYARNDKEVIAAWRSDLNIALDVFNVGWYRSVWQCLTISHQTQLAVGTHVIVSDIHRDVSELCRDVSDIRLGVSQILGDEGQMRQVGATCS